MPRQMNSYLYKVYVWVEQPTTLQSIASWLNYWLMLSLSEFVIWLFELTRIVLQISNVYSIRSPTLLRIYLRIRLLERHFDYIEYQHILRSLNTLTDALANYVLDRHLNHL
jgi:hypothetical protein